MKYENKLGRKHQIIRFIWGIVWCLFARPIPRSVGNGWKLFLLRLFGAKVSNSAVVYSSAKIISLIAGAVSILTLERTMLTTFGATENLLFNRIILSITGSSIIGFAITMAIIMIIKGNKALNKIKNKFKN